MTESPVLQFVRLVRDARIAGFELTEAVRQVRLNHPQLVIDVLDSIGSWPSSESELRELQRGTP